MKSRFGNKQLIINRHMETLFNINSVKSGLNIQELHQLHDLIESQVRSLKSLGVPSSSYGSLLSSVVMSKLLQELWLIITREVKDKWDEITFCSGDHLHSHTRAWKRTRQHLRGGFHHMSRTTQTLRILRIPSITSSLLWHRFCHLQQQTWATQHPVRRLSGGHDQRTRRWRSHHRIHVCRAQELRVQNTSRESLLQSPRILTQCTRITPIELRGHETKSPRWNQESSRRTT